MPKKSGKKGKAGAPLRAARKELDEEMYDEVDHFHRSKMDEYISLNDDLNDDDESGLDNGEEAVFDLDVASNDSDSDDDDEDEEEEDASDEEDFPKSKINKVEAQMPGLLSEEEEDDEKDLRENVRKWGKYKQDYYNADANDLEIGQDFEDAQEEEKAAREVEQARYDDMDEDDYELEQPDEEEETMGNLLKKNKKKQNNLKSLLASHEMEAQSVTRNLSKLSRSGKLQVVLTDSPELLTLLEEFKEKLGELRDRVEPLLPFVKKQGHTKITEESVAYLEVKQQLLLSYCINLTYYMLLKAEGKSVKDHPVIDQLLELRAALEKMRPLDAKLRFRIERLLKVAENGSMDAGDPLSFRPNPEALTGKGPGNDDDEEGEKRGAGVYRPPRLAAVPYEDDSNKKTKDALKARKSLEKLRRNEILQSLTEQFSDKPELVTDEGMGDLQKKAMEKDDERRKFEEERFIRLVTSKKDKALQRAARQQASRLETIADIGDFHDFEESLSALGNNGARHSDKSKAQSGNTEEERETSSKKSLGATALQKAVNSLAQRQESKKRQRMTELGGGDMDVPYRSRDELRISRSSATNEVEDTFDDEDVDTSRKTKKKKRSGREENEEEDNMMMYLQDIPEDPLYEAMASKRAQKKAEKQALYAVEANYGAREAELVDGEKRGINYQILKNKGLTAYKNKLNRNPRVKKKEAYRKAVIRRKGQVRDVRATESNSYCGEATGINAKVVRVRGKK